MDYYAERDNQGINVPYTVYSYKKKPGWYPSQTGGWTRLWSGIKVWETEEDALNCAPTGCDVVELYLKLEGRNIIRG